MGFPEDRLTVIVPAYNEAATLADTLRSLRRQTLPPAEIVVVDDCSTDETAEIAHSFGVTVLRPPVNTGSKAGAQTFALDRVRTERDGGRRGHHARVGRDRAPSGCLRRSGDRGGLRVGPAP